MSVVSRDLCPDPVRRDAPNRHALGDAAVPVSVDGKQFRVGAYRFPVRGVTYGTFQPRHDDGARFPEPTRIDGDFAMMAAEGFNTVRVYTLPPPDLIELAGKHGLRVLSDVFYPDWRYLMGSSRRAQRRIAAEAAAEVRSAARRHAGDPRILALSLGNEIPADVVRWVGTSRVAAVLAELGEVIREEDPDRLITYANYPTAEYLPLEHLDFLTFNVFLEDRDDLRSYLTRLQHLAGDRPLMLGEVGLNSCDTVQGEADQARALDWQLETALERGLAGTCTFSWTDEWWVGENAVEGWYFGLTRADRTPRAALKVAARWNRATVADLQPDWPSISVVICAYNAEDTLDECLTHTCSLEYPGLEILVVDDGSTDATAQVAARHSRARLISLEHGGLSNARNEGFRAATGELVAYLDSDAFPTPEWPFFIALGFDAQRVAGVGGPNLPPGSDPRPAQIVARAPGGPMQVMLSDARAEHIPGCNMTFWREFLEEVGGFDPVYTAAGDDVDLCWKVLDRGWEIGFHPAALVWHHARRGTVEYIRQQRGYGQSEALVEARHPHRFTSAGSARWRGHIYDSFAPRMLQQRVYRGAFGAAAYQSVYHAPSDTRAIIRQLGVPTSTLALPAFLLALKWPVLLVPALLAAIFLTSLFAVEAATARIPRRIEKPLLFRCSVAWLTLLQPLARSWGRTRHRTPARRSLALKSPPPPILSQHPGGVVMFAADRSREELAAEIIGLLRGQGMRIDAVSGWEDHDARVFGSTLMRGKIITSSHPVGCVQLRVNRRLRFRWAVTYGVVAAVSWLVSPAVAVIVLGIAAGELVRGVWRTGPAIRRRLAPSGVLDASSRTAAQGRVREHPMSE